MTRSALYRGSLVHTRRDHLCRTFRYPVFMTAIDLDEAHDLDRDLRLFSLDRPNVFSLYARDYSTSLDLTAHVGTDDAASLGPIAPVGTRDAASLDPIVPVDTSSPAGRDITSTTLVTNLRFAGYAFNPVSFFLRYAGDELASVIAEVNNTYGGRHCYTLDASNRLASGHGDLASGVASGTGDRDGPSRVGFRTAREFFVSPFLHGPRVYEWWFPAKRDPERLAITMHVDTTEGDRIFTASFAGERRALTDRALIGAALRYPVNTAQVIGLIHLEALKLRLLHREPYRRPGPDHRPLDT